MAKLQSRKRLRFNSRKKIRPPIKRRIKKYTYPQRQQAVEEIIANAPVEQQEFIENKKSDSVSMLDKIKRGFNGYQHVIGKTLNLISAGLALKKMYNRFSQKETPPQDQSPIPKWWIENNQTPV